ncbi:DNA-binding response regulator [Pseudoalteromonas sp. A25]|uniref:LytR/AlgR family response regulator transcription factor n=1 Tax=Pseudoalteromonas sp. A25 TaxID=116092 RepID=UPI001260866E|nr:LytTR family DNA-binding domain-containing protein [Pseudoalteromonas sp. A25]BBN81833.1 DNA-binding response regulator [Pseudoalteromonas sp. A25]
MAFRCWIIDDETAAHKGLEIALSPYQDFLITAHFYALEELPEQENASVDVIFLDIEMPRANGFSLFEKWQRPLPVIILVTAYQQYALRAFENHVFDYVLKPIDETRFKNVVKRLQDRLNEKQVYESVSASRKEIGRQSPHVKIQTDSGIQLVELKEIVYFQAVGDFVAVKLDNQELVTRSTLKAFVRQFSNQGVVQIHRSFAINIVRMERLENASFGDAIAYMSTGEALKVSRRYKKAVLDLLDAYTA